MRQHQDTPTTIVSKTYKGWVSSPDERRYVPKGQATLQVPKTQRALPTPLYEPGHALPTVPQLSTSTLVETHSSPPTSE